jgi:hypothetical protein
MRTRRIWFSLCSQRPGPSPWSDELKLLVSARTRARRSGSFSHECTMAVSNCGRSDLRACQVCPVPFVRRKHARPVSALRDADEVHKARAGVNRVVHCNDDDSRARTASLSLTERLGSPQATNPTCCSRLLPCCNGAWPVAPRRRPSYGLWLLLLRRHAGACATCAPLPAAASP